MVKLLWDKGSAADFDPAVQFSDPTDRPIEDDDDDDDENVVVIMIHQYTR